MGLVSKGIEICLCREAVPAPIFFIRENMGKKVFILIAQNYREEIGWEIIGVFNNLENAEKLKNQIANTSLAADYIINEFEVM